METIHNNILTSDVQNSSGIRSFLLVVGASLLIGLCGSLAIPLPFSPIPLAIQNGVVILMGILLGSKRGALAVLAFLFQGAIGLPVFANGKAGIAVLAGTNGGYLWGYVAAAYVVGMCLERMKERSLVSTFLAIQAGHLVVFVFGVSWLALFLGMKQALLLGFVPFIIGDFILKPLLLIRSLRALRFFGRMSS